MEVFILHVVLDCTLHWLCCSCWSTSFCMLDHLGNASTWPTICCPAIARHKFPPVCMANFGRFGVGRQSPDVDGVSVASRTMLYIPPISHQLHAPRLSLIDDWLQIANQIQALYADYHRVPFSRHWGWRPL